jgi:HK97 family phage portal protein
MMRSQSSTITTRNSYQFSAWVYSAVTIIADWINQNPFVIESGGRQVTGGPLYKMVHRPNEYRDQNTVEKFTTAYMTELLLSGSVLRVFTGMDGIQPDGMVVFPRNHWTPQWAYDDLGVQVVTRWAKLRGGRSVTMINNDEIHLDALYNPFHDFEGLSPLHAALLGVNSDISLSELLQRFFDNNASTGLIMSTKQPLNKNQIVDAQKAWDLQHGGMKNAYATKFIGFGFEPKQIGTNFDATVQRVLKQLTREEIMTGIFKIPPSIYSGQQPSEGVQIGGRSIEPETESFLINVIMVWAKRFDQEFNQDVATRFPGEAMGRHDFTTNSILERRRLDRAKAAVELIDRGVTLNQVIEWLRLELRPEPHGNDWWLRNNMVPARVLLDAPSDALLPPTRQSRAQQDARDAVTDELVESVKRLVESVQFKDQVRSDPALAHQSNGKTNAQRIEELLP